MQGKAETIRDKGGFQAPWNPDMERGLKQGVDTPGMVLIKVHATRFRCRDGEHDGEVDL